MKKWLLQEEFDLSDGKRSLSCPHCSYIDRRWTDDELRGDVVGCIGCGVSSQHPTQRELHAATGE